jgi:hypothetical protein
MLNSILTANAAAPDALTQLDRLVSREDYEATYRVVDLVNIGIDNSQMAHAILERDPARARELLIHGASRLLAAAERLS